MSYISTLRVAWDINNILLSVDDASSSNIVVISIVHTFHVVDSSWLNSIEQLSANVAAFPAAYGRHNLLLCELV